MNERNKTRWIIPEPIHIVERNEDSGFQKDASGTSGGRAKRTAAEQQAIDQMKELTPEAVEVIHGILGDENAPLYTRRQAAKLILNRAMGSPETYLRVENANESQEESGFTLLDLLESCGAGEAPDAAEEDPHVH